MKSKRLLTIGYQCQIRNQNNIARNYISVPQLRLAGKWLNKAGFRHGDIVEVEAGPDCLVIRKTHNTWKIEKPAPQKFMVNETGTPI